MAVENNKGLLSLNIKGKSALYVSYMPFIKNGGIFIPSKKTPPLYHTKRVLLKTILSKM